MIHHSLVGSFGKLTFQSWRNMAGLTKFWFFDQDVQCCHQQYCGLQFIKSIHSKHLFDCWLVKVEQDKSCGTTHLSLLILEINKELHHTSCIICISDPPLNVWSMIFQVITKAWWYFSSSIGMVFPDKNGIRKFLRNHHNPSTGSYQEVTMLTGGL